MGTYTIGYSVKRILANPAHFFFIPAIYWWNHCWEEAAIYKRSMMKGQSRMYADRIKNIPANEDPWRY